MILNLLENVLTETQFYKTRKLLEAYPELLKGEEVVALTRDISAKTGIRSDHVIRDLKKIASVCGRFQVEPVYLDDRQKIVEDLFGFEEQRIQAGGRKVCRGLKLNWISWQS